VNTAEKKDPAAMGQRGAKNSTWNVPEDGSRVKHLSVFFDVLVDGWQAEMIQLVRELRALRREWKK
jgi:hypothetical protein